jgi:hypothetical protein
MGGNAPEAVAQAQVQGRAVFRRGAPGVGQGLRPDVRRDGGGDPPLLHQPHRKVAMVCADIRQVRPCRNHIRQQAQPGLQL